MTMTFAAAGAIAPLGCLAPFDPDTGAHRQGDPLFMTSFARGWPVIRALSGPRRPRTIAHIGRVTGLSRAAVHCCLYTLCELGYVRGDGRMYRLLPKALTPGQDALLFDRCARPRHLPGRRLRFKGRPAAHDNLQ
jgi:hypothetical protein